LLEVENESFQHSRLACKIHRQLIKYLAENIRKWHKLLCRKIEP